MSAETIGDEVGRRAFGTSFLRALRRWRGVDVADRKRVLGILNHRARAAGADGDTVLAAALNAAGVVLRAVDAIVSRRVSS